MARDSAETSGRAEPAASCSGTHGRRPPAGDRRAGFSLVEVLVALVLAGFLVFAVSRALSVAWRSARAPGAMVAAASIGAALLEGLRAQPEARIVPGPGRHLGFDYEIAAEPVTAELLASPVPRAPAESTGEGQRRPGGNGPGGAAGGEEGRDKDAKPPQPYRVVVVVTAPSGRSVRLETVKLVSAR